MRCLLVIHEKDHQDNEKSVIGIADSVNNANKVISEYYGSYNEISYTDIRDSNLEWSKVLEVSGAFGKHYRVTVTLEWFELNSA